MDENSSLLQSFQNNERYGLVDRIENDIIQLMSDSTHAHAGITPEFSSRDSLLSPDSEMSTATSLVRSALQSCVMLVHPGASVASRLALMQIKRLTAHRDINARAYMYPKVTFVLVLLLIAAFIDSFLVGQQSVQAYNGVLHTASRVPHVVLYAAMPMSLAVVSMILLQTQFPHKLRIVSLLTVTLLAVLQTLVMYAQTTQFWTNTSVVLSTYGLTLQVAQNVNAVSPYLAGLAHPLQRSLIAWVLLCGFFVGVQVTHFTSSFWYSIAAALFLCVLFLLLPNSPCDIISQSLDESAQCDGYHDCHCFMENLHLTQVTSILQRTRGYSNVTFDLACLIRSCLYSTTSGNGAAALTFAPPVSMGEPTFSRGLSVVGRSLRPISPILDPFIAPSLVNPLLTEDQERTFRSLQMEDECMEMSPMFEQVPDQEPQQPTLTPSCTPNAKAMQSLLYRSRQLFTLPYHPVLYVVMLPSQCFAQLACVLLMVQYRSLFVPAFVLLVTVLSAFVNLCTTEQTMRQYSFYGTITLGTLACFLGYIFDSPLFFSLLFVSAAILAISTFTPALLLKHSNPSLVTHANTIGTILTALLFTFSFTSFIPCTPFLGVYCSVLVAISLYILQNKP